MPTDKIESDAWFCSQCGIVDNVSTAGQPTCLECGETLETGSHDDNRANPTPTPPEEPKTYTAISPEEGGRNEVVRSGTARQDTVAKILKNDWVVAAVCRGEYTDDYKRDAARDFGKGSVSPEYIRSEMETVDPEWCRVREMRDGRQIVTIWWGFQSYELELDPLYVEFEYDMSDDDESDSGSDLPPAPDKPSGEVFEELSTGDQVVWDGKQKLLEVTIGYEEAKDRQAEGVSFEPSVWLEGPRGGEKRLKRSAENQDVVSVVPMSLSGSPSTISDLRVVENSDDTSPKV